MTCHCGHPKGLHVGITKCRVTGCRCEQFRDASKPEPVETEEPKGQRVTFEIPPGFSFQVTFMPVTYVVGERGPELVVPADASTAEESSGG